MKILFHCDQLNERGTEVAIYDYARYNQEILNNQSIVVVNTDNEVNSSVLDKFNKSFNVILYSKIHNNINKICDNQNIDCVYYLKSGINDGYLSNRKNLIHCVFRHYEPHGNKYAYISEWLCNHINRKYNVQTQWVPHIIKNISPTKVKKIIRNEYGLPEQALVIGRYGGKDSFDIPQIYSIILQYLNQNNNCYFVFLNTIKFVDHPRVKFYPAIINEEEKTNFVHMCDAMIHARSNGETFGLSICEFLRQNKPVLACDIGDDKNHIELLKNTQTLYRTPEDLLIKLNQLDAGVFNNYNYSSCVDEFSPSLVMQRFKSVFLER